MIKIGCNFLSLPDMNVETFIDTCYQLGLDVIDFHSRAFASGDPEYLLGVKRRCLERGLPIGYLGVSNDFVGTDEVLRTQIERCRQAIDLAAFLGAPLIRVFAGHVPAGIEDREPLFETLARCNREVAEHGARRGVVVALQNHDNHNLAATAEDVLRILREADHPNFAFILDTGQWQGSIGAHPLGNPDPRMDVYAAIEQTAPHAVWVRAKFYRVESGRETWLDYRRILDLLQRARYNGCLSIVYEGEETDRVAAVGKAARHLRALLGRA